MLVVYALATYLVVGLAVGTAFVLAGIPRALRADVAVTPLARLLLIPGAALLWPLVLRRWLCGAAP